MSRRNPMNERYGKYTAPGGKTRKSAASAKPKRSGPGGSAVGSSKGAKSPATKKPRPPMYPQTPEYRKLRRIWLGLLLVAIVLSIGSWLLWSSERQAGSYVLAAGYVFIFAAIALDMLKMRPLRNAWLAERAGGGSKQKKADESKPKDADTGADRSAEKS